MFTVQRRAVTVKRWWAWVLAAVLAAGMPACKKSSEHKVVPPSTQPEARPAASAPATTAAASEPASQPTTQAASQPVSSYISHPPYPVQLYVLSPEDKQPGWLKILQLADDNALAVCKGVFPEQNLIEVETGNVARLRIHIGHLPIGERKRIVLRLDGQGIELARKNRAFVILQRSPTGQWRITSSED
ncbi:MAG TPA: hypothetical protein VLM89_06105 [Phycisphaerae bacterium]|nr:hypothetical protein [Phycisphaerae bacterium]